MSYRFADSLRAGSGWYVTRCTNFSNFFLEWNSTCFGQFLCPSSGVFHCKHSNGICHTGLLTACEQDQDGTQLDALISQIYSLNETRHVLDSSSVHHQEFFTVHTAMLYVVRVCWQLASRIWMILLASCQQTYMTYTIAVFTVKNSWWWTEELSEICRFLFLE